jgi:hypothetical protein
MDSPFARIERGMAADPDAPRFHAERLVECHAGCLIFRIQRLGVVERDRC